MAVIEEVLLAIRNFKNSILDLKWEGNGDALWKAAFEFFSLLNPGRDQEHINAETQKFLRILKESDAFCSSLVRLLYFAGRGTVLPVLRKQTKKL